MVSREYSNQVGQSGQVGVNTSVTPVLRQMHWLPVRRRVQYAHVQDVCECVSSFLTAHQHILGYLVPYNDVEDTVKEVSE